MTLSCKGKKRVFSDCDVCNLMGWALFWMLYWSFQALGNALGVFLIAFFREIRGREKGKIIQLIHRMEI